MNPNCYHLYGPSGVKMATQRLKEVIAVQNPQYIIRADINLLRWCSWWVRTAVCWTKHELLTWFFEACWDAPAAAAAAKLLPSNVNRGQGDNWQRYSLAASLPAA